MITAQNPALELVLIEDDDIDAESFARLLAPLGSAPRLTVYATATDALEALRVQIQNSRVSRLPLIFLDLGLPGMSGLEFLRQLRQDEQLRAAVVFVYTDARSADNQAAAYDWSIAGYLVKSHIAANPKLLTDLLAAYLHSVQFSTRNPVAGLDRQQA